MPPPRSSKIIRGIRFKGIGFGFTLAEVLITLGIIGVVATLTLPSILTQKVEKERVSQLKKVYSTLNQAYLQTVSENGTPDEWGMETMDDELSHYIFAKNFRPYLRLSKDCIDLPPGEVAKVCQVQLTDSTTAKSVILIDGTTVTFRVYDGNCTHMGRNVCGEFRIDLNGHRLPNKNGEDIFRLYFSKDGVIPFGLQNSIYTFERGCNKNITSPYPTYDPANMYACAGWVIYNENMDYLHCDDLSWDGKHKCDK